MFPHILYVVDEIVVHESVQTRFVAPQNPSIDTILVIKVIISYDNFIAIDPMKKIGARFSFLIFTDKKFIAGKQEKCLSGNLV